MIATKKE